MLQELKVRNFAIIDGLDLNFKAGLNVLTGETGAGKSIIIGALGVALGERAYTEMIKTGSDSASVEAYFETRLDGFLENIGLPASGGIILRRSLSSSGKTKAYINDAMVNVYTVAELGKKLVDIHGQHEHQSLLSPDNQLRLLDRFGKIEGDRLGLEAAYREAQGLRKKVEELKSDSRQRAQKIDLLKFQLNEIKTASISAGEDKRLEEEKKILANLGRLNELTSSAYDLLYSSEGSCVDDLSKAEANLREISSIDNASGETLGLLQSALLSVKDASLQLRDLKDKYDADPERLSAIEDRLEIINNLKRKYGDTIDAVLAHMEKADMGLREAEDSDEALGGVEDALKAKEKQLDKAASEVSAKRKETAKKTGEDIRAVLGELALGKAGFEVEIKNAPMSSTGVDSVEFLFSANPGEALKPLTKVASGGELSRIMLAIKSVLQEADEIPVLIFDEVDSGIGGKTAQNVAAKLKGLSKGRQVLCITHLAQIASQADAHFLIEKKEQNGKVGVSVREIKGIEKQEEIARMLSGTVTETSLKHAGEIIKGGSIVKS